MKNVRIRWMLPLNDLIINGLSQAAVWRYFKRFKWSRYYFLKSLCRMRIVPLVHRLFTQNLFEETLSRSIFDASLLKFALRPLAQIQKNVWHPGLSSVLSAFKQRDFMFFLVHEIEMMRCLPVIKTSFSSWMTFLLLLGWLQKIAGFLTWKNKIMDPPVNVHSYQR